MHFRKSKASQQSYQQVISLKMGIDELMAAKEHRCLKMDSLRFSLALELLSALLISENHKLRQSVDYEQNANSLEMECSQ
jgi:hypothetical protein